MSEHPGPGRRVLFAFAAGQVRRWHAAGHVIRQQNVMEHSGGMALWLTLLHPDPSANLLKAAMIHDLGELKTGDMPRYAKMINSDIQLLLSRVEDKVLIQYGLNQVLPQLTKEEDDWLHSIDLFDAWLFMFQNLLAGNHMMQGDLNKATYYLEDWNKTGEPHKCADAIIIAVRQIRAIYPWVKIY